MSTTDARLPQHPIANTEQAAAGNGPEGANWKRASTDTDDHGLTAPVLDAAGVAGGDRVLDIGCGTGAPTRQAALRAGTGSAVGVDLAAAMVDEAAAAAAARGVANARFEVGDAERGTGVAG